VARRIKIGESGASTDTRGTRQEKALAEVSVDDREGGQSGGFIFNLFSNDAERELTQESVLEAYHSSPPLHMAVSAISRAVGETTYLWEDDADPGDWSPASPNRWHQSSELFGLVAAYLKLTGECYLIKAETARGIELIPIPTHLIEEPDIRSGKWILEDGAISLSQTEYDRDELVILQYPSLLDPFMHGRGSGQVVGGDVDVNDEAARYTASFLENDAMPSAIVNIEGVTRDDRERFRESMRKRHGGPSNAGKLEAFDAQGISVETLMTPFDELGMNDLRRYSAEVVRQVFGIPPSVIGDVSDTNRATAETEEYLFKKNLIKPLVDKIVEGLNEQFVRQDLGEQYTLTTGPIVPEDRRFKKELMADIPQAFRVNEARALADLEPLDGQEGEQTLVEAMPAGPVRRNAEPDHTCGHDHGREAQKKITPLAVKQPDDERVRAVLDAVDAEDMDELEDRFADAMRAEGEQTIQGLGESFGGGLLDEAVEAKVNDRFSWVLPDIADHTRGQLQADIVEGLDEGKNPRRIAQKLRKRFDEDYATWRAERIARTEMLTASNAGTWEAHKASDVAKMRSWLSTRDGNVRPAHVELDNRTSKTPIPVTQPFEIAGESANHPGDFPSARLSVNCRCTTVVEFPDRRRTEAQREKLWRQFVKRLDDQEKRTRDVVRQAFARQRDKVLDAFQDAFDVRDVA